MKEFWDFLVRFSDFLATYGMMKCAKTMIAGTMMLCLIIMFQRLCKGKNANRNFYAFLLLLPMAFMGASKLFFLPGMVSIHMILTKIATPACGKFYFSIMTFLLFHFLWCNFKAARQRRHMEHLCHYEMKEKVISCITSKDTFRLAGKYLHKTEIYVLDQDISPYCSGIIRPFIVLPTKIVKEWSEDEQFGVLCHEMIHLKSGHIIWITLFHLLSIYWWINPFVYLAKREMLEQMEMVCDEKCVMQTKMEAECYGRLLLAIAAILQSVRREDVASFFSRNNFHILKKRLLYLKKCSQKRCMRKRGKYQNRIFVAALAGICLTIAATSYPKYTVIEEISLYDEKLNLICEDVNRTIKTVEVKDGELVIDERNLDLLMDAYQVEGDYIYLSYGTIMKVPGVGGGGNAGMVSTHDYKDILYLSADCAENHVAEFWLKYLI